MDETTKEQRQPSMPPRWKWHGSPFWLLRVLIGLIVLIIVFWLGVKVGEFHSFGRFGLMGHRGFYGGMMGRGYYGYPPGWYGTSTPQGQYFPPMMRGYYGTTTPQ